MTVNKYKWDWVGRIETASGSEVDVLNFTPDMVSLSDIIQSLSKICRYNGHVPHFYSVAEHSVFVAELLASHGHSATVCLTGLLHDAAEAYVGDMVRPLKNHPDFGGIHQKIEAGISQTIHTVLGGFYPHPEAVHMADKAVYEWEVDNIRSGLVRGLEPLMAAKLFNTAYSLLSASSDAELLANDKNLALEERIRSLSLENDKNLTQFLSR